MVSCSSSQLVHLLQIIIFNVFVISIKLMKHFTNLPFIKSEILCIYMHTIHTGTLPVTLNTYIAYRISHLFSALMYCYLEHKNVYSNIFSGHFTKFPYICKAFTVCSLKCVNMCYYWLSCWQRYPCVFSHPTC